jgi:hypothetical protein
VKALRWVVASVLAALMLAAPASAAQRFAGYPTDYRDATDCASPATFCSLAKAVNGAAPGDEVVLVSSYYDQVSSSVSAPAGVTIRPRDGLSSTPTITLTAAPNPFVLGPGATLRDVRLVQTGSGDSALRVVGGTVERVMVSSSAAAAACAVSGTVIDTVCWNGKRGGAAVTTAADTGTAQGDLHNVTAWSEDGPGLTATAGPAASAAVDVKNTIVHGETNDVTATAGTGGTARVTFDHSNFARTATGGPGTAAITAPDANGNQSEPPQLTTDGWFRQLTRPWSPTLDAGVADPRAGDLDVTGGPRTIRGATDIGATEAAQAPTVVVGPVTDITETAATINATINPNGNPRTFYGVMYETGGQQHFYVVPQILAPPSPWLTPVPISVRLNGLTPGSPYHYVVSPSGPPSDDQPVGGTFTTAGSPPQPPPSSSGEPAPSGSAPPAPDARAVSPPPPTAASGTGTTPRAKRCARTAAKRSKKRSKKRHKHTKRPKRGKRSSCTTKKKRTRGSTKTS